VRRLAYISPIVEGKCSALVSTSDLATEFFSPSLPSECQYQRERNEGMMAVSHSIEQNHLLTFYSVKSINDLLWGKIKLN